MTRGAKGYFAATLVGQVAALLRYVLLSRILGPEQLGYAAMLILTAQFFEFITDTSVDRFIVQDKDGDTTIMQKVVQLALFGRGCLLASALVVTAIGMRLYDPTSTFCYSVAALAIPPLISGLLNVDQYRAQRTGDFRPASVVQVTSEISGLIGTGIAAFIVRDHTAILYGLAAKAVAQVVFSHLVAKRLYGWSYSRPEAATFRRFAIPLFLNGLLLFFGGQGDRLLVGFLGPAELGKYSAILLLIYYPTNVVLRFMQSIHMPRIAASRTEPELLRREARALGGRSFLLAVGVIAGFTLVGPFMSPLLFGPSFAHRPEVFALLAALEGARFLRLWPVTIALAEGRTTIVMLDNASRLVALPLAGLALLMTHSLEAILIALTFGEYISLVTTLWLLSRVTQVSLLRESGRLIMLLIVTTLACLWALAVPAQQMTAMGALLVASLAATIWIVRSEHLVIREAIDVALSRLTALRRRAT
ncbi:MAG: oligosaccharide flippase family protein [Alphaproteobacteria bacterium]|nr:oligosaccharide flippase family protein [Alphaproteobacteria bacterium]MBU1512942.1 oligosaccharide flippase family protein [Alphaproteobacteria bacterium]MBU2094884.1 oligosaccharide flippase family protein [Alphaproteobacteria bacterium]MBU2152790.1 oligosaccharide flippase family protein [Alphaproteobacteria bacterium]MBU2306301.1 oligosaccharide flippase family protein [Alphaproteobacteria bacterium]